MKFIFKKQYQIFTLYLCFIQSGLSFASDGSNFFDQLYSSLYSSCFGLQRHRHRHPQERRPDRGALDANSSVVSIMSINSDVLGHTLKFLNAKDLGKFSETCTKSYDIACSNYANSRETAQELDGRWYRHERILRDPKLFARVKEVHPNYLQQFTTIFEVNDVRFTFVMIPGRPSGIKPAKKDTMGGVTWIVKIAPFLMQQTQVTQAQWQAVMGNNPSEFQGNNRPVENVSFNDVQEFIARLNGLLKDQGILLSVSLPTEKEWEYAARAGTMTRYPWGDDKNGCYRFAWGTHNSGDSTQDVAKLEPNAFELYDMIGNVWELTSSKYALYDHRINHRVIRGGSWKCAARNLDSETRADTPLDGCYSSVGFRVVVRTP